MSMAILGSSYFDLITGAIGAYMYMIVWDVLKMTGVVFFAFVAVIGQALVDNYESDNLNDEPHQQLNRLTVQLVVMVFALIFVAMPIIEVDSLKLRVATRQCEVIPTASASDIRLTPANWNVLESHGAEYLVEKLLEEKRLEGLTNNLVPAVANQILTGSLRQEFYKKSQFQSEYYEQSTLVIVLYTALKNKNMGNVMSDLGVTISSVSGSVYVPIWWQTWRNYMLGVNSAIIAKIPCDSGLRMAKEKFEMDFITDESLKNEFLEFYEQCHAPAVSKWTENETRKSRGLVDAMGQRSSAVIVPGSLELLSNGYYEGLRSSVPVKGFGSVSEEKGFSGNANADGSINPPVPDGTGYPACDQWWLHPQHGLEANLKTHFNLHSYKGIRAMQKLVRTNESDESRLLQRVLAKKITGESIAAQVAGQEISKKLSGAYLATHEMTAESDSLGSTLLGIGVDVGIITSYAERMAGFKALLRAIPVATSLLIMLFMAIIPIGLVIGRFSIGAIMGLTLTYACFYLWIPYFRLVKWIDDNLISIFNLNALSTDKMMIDLLIGACYIAVPALITSVATIAGVRLASFDPIGAGNIGSIGQGGAKTSINGAKALATKGKGAAAKGAAKGR